MRLRVWDEGVRSSEGRDEDGRGDGKSGSIVTKDDARGLGGPDSGDKGSGRDVEPMGCDREACMEDRRADEPELWELDAEADPNIDVSAFAALTSCVVFAHLADGWWE